MSEQLKPCPFCGGEVLQGQFPQCRNTACRCEAFSYDEDDNDSAMANAWNTRPIEDALRKERDAARAALIDVRRERDATREVLDEVRRLLRERSDEVRHLRQPRAYDESPIGGVVARRIVTTGGE